MTLCMNRLAEERYVSFYSMGGLQFSQNITSSKLWRKDPPFGFYARPMRNAQGVLDLKNWECGIPGKEKTIWEGGQFKLTMQFPDGKDALNDEAFATYARLT